MPFLPPIFNLLADYWDSPNLPYLTAPDVIGIPCQKYIYSKLYGDSTQVTQQVTQLRLPTGSIILDANGGIFEVPATSGRFFRRFFVGVQHEGFPNEYILAVCVPCDDHGQSINGMTNP